MKAPGSSYSVVKVPFVGSSGHRDRTANSGKEGNESNIFR